MANKAERVLVANFLEIAQAIEYYASRAESENEHYKRLQEEYKGLRRDLRTAFDTDAI